MHLFRFQRIWFYPVDQGHPRLGYQTMSTIKRTLRYSRKLGEKEGFRWREKGGTREGIQMEEKSESSEV